MLPILQFTAAFPETQAVGLPSVSLPLFTLMIVGLALVAMIALIFIVRSVLHSIQKVQKAFDRVVIHILVPKERKSEGTSNNSQDDRLEQVKEEIGITETFFSTIAGLKPEHGLGAWFRGRNDHISFEVVVHNNLINFYVGVPQKLKPFIEQQINAQYPYAHIEEITDYNIFGEHSSIVGAYLKGKEVAALPFKTYKKMDSDPMSGVLNAIARIHEQNSSAAIQFVVRAAPKKWRKEGVHIVREVRKGKRFEEVIGGKNVVGNFLTAIGSEVKRQAIDTKEQKQEKASYQPSALEDEMMKGIEEKLVKGGLEVTIRVVSASDNPDMASLNLDNIVNSFSPYNLYRYGNSLGAVAPKNPQSIIRSFIYRSFHEKRYSVLNTEEMASFWHLPLHSTEAPNIKWLMARKAPPPPNLPKEGITLGRVLYRGQEYPVKMKEEDRRRHLYIIGKSGGGKSVFIENLAVQDIINGKGVAVIDPHGDFAEYVLQHIPKERADDVVIFNPSDVERPVGLNMLEAHSEDEKDFAVQEMIAIFYKLFPPEMIGPMFEHNMRNVMLTLMADLDDPGTIIDIPRMFTDDAYVKKYLVKLKDPVVRAFWEKEMAKTSDFHKSEMLGYLISKVGRFVENEMMRNIIGQNRSGFDFRDVMDKKKILLVNLSKGTTGEVNAKLLGLIIVAKLQMAALSRADLPEEKRHDFYLYIDEFQNFITDSIATILSEARKYRLNLIIAHQYMGQLTEGGKNDTSIRDAVLGNAGTLVCFRIGVEDAEILAKEYAPVFSAYDLINVEQYTAYIKLLIDNTAAKPFNMGTLAPLPENNGYADKLKQLSRLKFGRDRRIVQEEIMDRSQLGASTTKAAPLPIEPTK